MCGAFLVRIWVVLSTAVLWPMRDGAIWRRRWDAVPGSVWPSLRRARPWLRRVSLVVTLPGEHVRSTCESYPQSQEYPAQRGAGLVQRMQQQQSRHGVAENARDHELVVSPTSRRIRRRLRYFHSAMRLRTHHRGRAATVGIGLAAGAALTVGMLV